MRTRCFIAGILLLLTMALGQSVSAQSIQKRDLARYADGGSFDFSWGLGPKALEGLRAKLREFLWEHWSQKRLGRVIATFYTIEGDPTIHDFYVEPGKDGRWRIVSRYESECCWFYGPENKKKVRRRGVEDYDTVEWVEQIKHGGASWKVIPEEARPEPSMYRLRLRNAVGGNRSGEAFIL